MYLIATQWLKHKAVGNNKKRKTKKKKQIDISAFIWSFHYATFSYFGWHTHLKDRVLLWFVDLASQTAVGDGIVNNRLVGLCTWLLKQFWAW